MRVCIMNILNPKYLEQNIDSVAMHDIEQNKVFGSSYSVFQKGNCLLKKHYGFADSSGKVPVNDSTVYRLASMTKPVTAFAMLILADRGMVSLDDPVKKYIPGFESVRVITPEGQDFGIPVNEPKIMHLLTHSSGFGSIKPVSMTPDDRETMESMISFYLSAGLDFEPFTKQAYSAVAAFDVLGAIVEKVSDTDYAEFLKKEIFIPCDMPDTTFDPTPSQWDRFMTMHNKTDDKSCVGNTYENCVFESFPAGHKLGGAGLASTLSDYMNFAKMLLNHGTTEDISLISGDTASLMSVPYVPEAIMPGNQRWGLGVRVITDCSYEYLPVGTYGWSGAYGSHFWIDPSNDICAVFMKNSRFDGGAGNISARMFEKAVYSSF